MSRATVVVALVAAMFAATVSAPAHAARPTDTGTFDGLALEAGGSDLLASLLDLDTSGITIDSSQLSLSVDGFDADGDTILASTILQGELRLESDAGELLGTVDLDGVSLEAAVEDLRARCSGSLSFDLALQAELDDVAVELDTSLGSLTLTLDGTVDLRTSVSIEAERGSDARQLICEIAKQLPVTASSAESIAADLEDLFADGLTGLTTLLEGSSLTALLDTLDLSQLQLDTSELSVTLEQFSVDDGTVVTTGVLEGTLLLRDGDGEVIGRVDLDRTTIVLRVSDLRADCSQGDLGLDLHLQLQLEDATVTLDTALGEVELQLSGEVELDAEVAISGATGQARDLICRIDRNLPVDGDSVQTIVEALNELLDIA